MTCLVTYLNASAQSPVTPRQLPFQQMAMPRMHPALTGSESLPAVPVHANHPLFQRSDQEVTIGTTVYDLQSNSGTPRRLVTNADGIRYGVWTIGNNAGSGYPDRGSGFNTQEGGAWGPIPDTRIEDARCGWANVDVVADGSPVVVAHRTDLNLMYFSRWENNAWVHTNIPTAVTTGVIWPRMAVGGPDGNTIHVIGLTYPSANGGAPYAGVDGHVLYYRSLDGGVTWDKQDVILPEIDQNFYTRMDADSYSIDASGNTVAIALMADFGDVKVSKSIDNGENWTTWTIKDFPIDAYAVDQGYTIDDIPLDTLAPDSLAIQSSDNTGAVLIDPDGTVHAWYGEMYYVDSDLTDGNFSYFPAWMGLRYWNETFGEDSTRVIVSGIIDANANGVADITGIDVIPLYFSSLTSHPSVGTDGAGNIFLAYSGLTENFTHELSTPTPGQHCRHIYLIWSGDKGETWSEPLDIIREDLVIEPDLLPLYETMFPAVDRHVDDQVHLIYQGDFEPGLAVRGDMDAAADNFINYLAIDVAELGINNTAEPRQDGLNMSLTPNPARHTVNLSWSAASAADTWIDLFDRTGRRIRSLQTGQVAAGRHSLPVSVGDLPAGLYFVQLRSGKQARSLRLVIQP
jgi:hypothetical protein